MLDDDLFEHVEARSQTNKTKSINPDSFKAQSRDQTFHSQEEASVVKPAMTSRASRISSLKPATSFKTTCGWVRSETQDQLRHRRAAVRRCMCWDGLP